MSDFDDDSSKADPSKVDPSKVDPNTEDWDDAWDDDDDDDGRRNGRRDLTLVYVVVAAAIIIVLAIVLTSNGDDSGAGGNSAEPGGSQPTEIVKNWQGTVGEGAGDRGADAQARASSTPGVTVWTDFWGWHVRSNRGDVVTVTVTAAQVRAKQSDDYDDSNEPGGQEFKTEIVSTIPPGDGTSGVGFDLGNSEAAEFTFAVDGQNIAVSEILVGGGDGVAAQNPVSFTKG